MWIISPQDLLVIGELLLTGNFNITRTLALTGSQFEKPAYVTVVAGASISAIVAKTSIQTTQELLVETYCLERKFLKMVF